MFLEMFMLMVLCVTSRLYSFIELYGSRLIKEPTNQNLALLHKLCVVSISISTKHLYKNIYT